MLAGCAAPSVILSPAETVLVDAMARRLTIAREVAWNKYLDGKPVRDPRREAAVLDVVTVRGVRRGSDAEWVRGFFAAQIAASCAQQEKLIHLWRRGHPLPGCAPRPLAEIRADIDVANEELLDALAETAARPAGFRAEAERDLRRAGVAWRPARIATAPLQP